MKTSISMRILGTMLLVLFAKISLATTYFASGTILKIISLDRTTYGSNIDSVLVSGFSSAGSCAHNDGLVGVVFRDDEGGKRQMAMALAAKVSGVTVNIRVDDSIKTANGYCFLQVLEFN